MELFFIDKDNIAEAINSAKQGKRTLIISDSIVRVLSDMVFLDGSWNDFESRRINPVVADAIRTLESKILPLFLDDTSEPTLSHIKEVCDKEGIQSVYCMV